MKVLILVDKLYPSHILGVKSGAFIAMTKIAKAISAQGNDVWIYSERYYGPDEDTDGLHYIGKSKLKLIFSARFSTLNAMARYFFKSKLPVLKRVKEMMKISEYGYLKRVINCGEFDIVNCQSRSIMNDFVLSDMKLRNTVDTIHGVFNGVVKLECSDEKYLARAFELERFETIFLKKSVCDGHHVVFVSRGLMLQCAALIGCKEPPACFHFIPNIVSEGPALTRTYDIQKKYNFPFDIRILVCSGTVGMRKNQKQLIEAMSLLPHDELDKLRLFICGMEQTDLRPVISRLHLENNVIITGFVEPAVMNSIYAQADAVVVASLYETFGMPIIEAYSYGKPVLLPTDLNAFEDCYDAKACISWNDRTTQGLADAIRKIFSQKWDSEYIKTLTKNFSSDRVGKMYCKLFSAIKKVN